MIRKEINWKDLMIACSLSHNTHTVFNRLDRQAKLRVLFVPLTEFKEVLCRSSIRIY